MEEREEEQVSRGDGIRLEGGTGGKLWVWLGQGLAASVARGRRPQ